MKGVEGTPEEQERLAIGNNNGSLDCKLPPAQEIAPRSVFHSTTLFMVVFLSGWVLQGMFLTYFVSVTTTIEKLFRIESKTTGVLLAASEIGQICTSLILTYLAGRGHRPRWIASMMIVLAVGVIGCVLPHILYGTQLLDVHLNVHQAGAAPVCSTYQNTTTCNQQRVDNTQTRSEIAAVVMPWLFVCLLIVGVGQTGITTLGIPYIDDNVGSKQSPLYMAITIGTRVLGPALGFLLGALCAKIYVYPTSDPGYESTDPRWVGAWWLGMVFITVFVMLLSSLMFFFPRQIKPEPAPMPVAKQIEKKSSFFKDFFATIKRQVTNDILMWRTASSVFHLMPISGVYAFLPKYLEQQFKLPTHHANLVSGLGGIMVMGLGVLSSGVVIMKVRLTARQIAAWTAITAAAYSVGMVLLMFVSCPEENFRSLGAAPGVNGSLRCSERCVCDDVTYNPVCGQDSYTYLSPCQAGCQESHKLDNSTWLYYGCACVEQDLQVDKVNDAIRRYSALRGADALNLSEWAGVGAGALNRSEWAGVGAGVAVSGECGGPCRRIYVFVALFALMMFVHATGETGAMLLTIRCTAKLDKAIAMGVIQFSIGVFGNVPCPIVFGAAVDAACRLRDAACGALGACNTYDNDKFRYFFLGLSAGIMFLAFLTDLLVFSKAHRIVMNPGEGGGEAAPARSPLSPLSPQSPPSPPPHDDTQF